MDFDFEAPLEELKEKIKLLDEKAAAGDATASSKAAQLRKKLEAQTARIYSTLEPWDKVQLARHPGRPTITRYSKEMCDDFIEIHGDRVFGDDPAMLCGFARIGDQRFMLIGHRKGDTVEQNIEYNFGMANPEGYRKAMRAMHLAEKWHLPVVTMVDTSGAFPGLEAEARGQAEAIGRNLMEMAALETPILTIVTGEGGSGGALGIAVGDRILMLENAVYSVISPEGCASILWRDGTKAPEAAKALHITSSDLAELKVIDGIIPEPVGGAHSHPEATMENVKAAIISNLKELEKVSASHLTENRYKKFAAIGRFN
ncbi:MAG: acetyl-CoA carboxylase carboxyltransferase subunit alpha [Kiritimatiellae bacterium]|nr:acetyl-CoA carboxylase carboxyltransferase subunit alpha [Kiritimatiellia bacterium]MBO7299080.1 acetyl-CoA carboxylase carboxyltransferase subunit alpha [Kiritimatiellia bacterium]